MIDLENMSVLIVDDMEGMCKSIRSMLKVLHYGKTHHYAHNGSEGWRFLKSDTHVDLAIIDWNMPVMNGVELLEHIREDRNFRDMPVVMVTAEANREIVAEAGESDIDAYILKPLTVRSLGDKIAMVVDKANNPPPEIRYLKQARDAEESGNIQDAVKNAKIAVKHDPTSSRPLRELGYYFYLSQKFEQAEKCWLKAAQMNPLDVYAFHHLGKLYLDRDDIDNAARYYDKAVKISPRHISRGIDFAKILIQKGLVGKAVSVFDKIIRLSRDPVSIREEIADVCMKNNIFDYAVGLYKFLVSTLPNRYDLIFKLAVALERIGEYRQAISQLLHVEKKDKENPEIQYRLAVNYMAIDQVYRAEQTLKNILRLNPDDEKAKKMLRQCV